MISLRVSSRLSRLAIPSGLPSSDDLKALDAGTCAARAHRVFRFTTTTGGITSFAFIMGVLPMVLSTGAGAEMRQAMGVAVFSGMIGVTFFGLVLTPVFYYLMRRNKATKESSE